MRPIIKWITLIELMIVFVIFGILAAVAIPAFKDNEVKTKLSKVRSALDPIKSILSKYYQENGSFPNVVSVSTSSGELWKLVGLPNGVSMPDEVDPEDFVVDGTHGNTVTIAFKMRDIRSDSIDGSRIVITGSGDGKAVTWACLSTPPGLDKIAQKHFGCP